MSESDLERELHRRGQELMQKLLPGHLDQRSPGEVAGSDGVECRERRVHQRPVETIFGTVDVGRVGYARPGHESPPPLDASLNLPVERYSLEVRRRVAEAADILEGKARRVASSMRRAATVAGLSSDTRKPVDTCADHLLKYAPYLQYDRYHASGYPIATGVVEGACRHLVRDRMELTGARWRLVGAEAGQKSRSQPHQAVGLAGRGRAVAAPRRAHRRGAARGARDARRGESPRSGRRGRCSRRSGAGCARSIP